MKSLPQRKRFLQPALCDSRVIMNPLAPCEILGGQGIPGRLEINGTLYTVEILGFLPAVGEPHIDGFRLTKDNGEAHDVCLVAGRLECTCGDWLWRRSFQTDRQLLDCKHCIACRKHFAAPVDQLPIGPALASSYTVAEDL